MLSISTTLPPTTSVPLADRHTILNNLWIKIIVVLVMGVVSVGLFFRQQISNGFTVLSGDRFDGIIETTILEHWYNFWRGNAVFNTTNYFYPTPDTLGYNDGYFLYGVIYSIARMVGLNPFIASESVNITVIVIGYIAFTWCAASMLRLSMLAAAFVGALFVLSSNMFVQSDHAQLMSVAFAPLLTMLLHRCLVAVVATKHGRAIAYGVLAAALHAAWLMTTFYMAWYFIFAGLWLSIVAVAGLWRHIPVAWIVLRNNWAVAISLLAFYILLNVPFLLTYIPKAQETGQHGFDAVMVYIPSVLDVFNIGPDNLIFGRIYDLLNQAIRPGFPDYDEKATGFPPLLLLVFALAIPTAIQRQRWATGPDPHRLAMLLAVAVILSWICVLRIGDHTFWALLYSVIPGAKAVRVVARYQIFLSFPVTLLAGYYIQNLHRTFITSAGLTVLALLVLEQIVVKPNVGLNVADELSRLDSVPPVPKSCGSFYVSTSREDSPNPAFIEGIYSHNVDAMMLAEYIGLPTINGFSTFTPPDWYLTRPSERARYLADVKKYATLNGLNDLCSLDLHALTWNANPFGQP